VSDTSIRIGSRSKRLFVVAVAVIVLGFIALALGSTTLAPILLVAGYLVLLPWAIIARDRPAKGSDTSAGEDSPGTGRGSGPGADGDQAEPAS
jgi:O-antigen ligase